MADIAGANVSNSVRFALIKKIPALVNQQTSCHCHAHAALSAKYGSARAETTLFAGCARYSPCRRRIRKPNTRQHQPQQQRLFLVVNPHKTDLFESRRHVSALALAVPACPLCPYARPCCCCASAGALLPGGVVRPPPSAHQAGDMIDRRVARVEHRCCS